MRDANLCLVYSYVYIFRALGEIHWLRNSNTHGRDMLKLTLKFHRIGLLFQSWVEECKTSCGFAICGGRFASVCRLLKLF